MSFGGFCPWLISLDYTASNASTWIIIAYTMERFTGVFCPVWKHKVCQPVTAKLIIAGVFFFSWLCSLPHSFAEQARSVPKSTKYMCDWKDGISREYKLALVWGQSLLSYVLPYILIISLNGLLVCRLRRWGNARESRAKISADIITGYRYNRESDGLPRITICAETHREDLASVSSERPRRLQPRFEVDNFIERKSSFYSRAVSRESQQPSVHDTCADRNSWSYSRAISRDSQQPSVQFDCDGNCADRKSRSYSRVVSRDSQQPSVQLVRADSVVTRRRKNKPVYVLCGVSLAFVLLWLPRFVSFLVLRLSPDAQLLEDFSLTLAMDVSNMLALLNSTINIFLYSFVDEKFRADLWKLLKGHSNRKISNDVTLPPPSHDTMGMAATHFVNNTVRRPSFARPSHDPLKITTKRLPITQRAM
ncbi:uncharacterized protein LOC144906565 [Branchiostoma floridae x Branchiostoma belcheri]